jgi:hypothetical protein
MASRRLRTRPGPDLEKSIVAPREYGLVRAYGKDVWLHSCGCIDALIPRLIEMRLDVLNPVQPEGMDISAGGGCIFSPAQSIQDDVPVENIQALLEVARERRPRHSPSFG